MAYMAKESTTEEAMLLLLKAVTFQLECSLNGENGGMELRLSRKS